MSGGSSPGAVGNDGVLGREALFSAGWTEHPEPSPLRAIASRLLTVGHGAQPPTTKEVLPMDWPETLRTERLRLRRVRVDDAPALFEAYAADERVTRFLTWPPNDDVAQMRQFLTALDDNIERGDQFAWVIQSGASEQLIGMVDVRLDAHVVELGYVLAHDRWGQGLMSEAVTAVVATAQQRPEVFRIWAYVDVDNPASGRVLDNAGLEHEGRLRRWALHPNVSSSPRDVDAYSWVR
jgi:ribosomal-protein-alanine N-acetyltransferase